MDSGSLQQIHWVGWENGSRDEAEVHCYQTNIDRTKNNWMCYLRVGNLKAPYGDHKATHLIHPNGPLQKKPWGLKEFAVAERDGTLLTFGETAGPDGSEERLKAQAQQSTQKICR